MKKIREPNIIYLRPVRIYRDDLEELLSILGSKSKTIDITSGDIQFDSLDEIAFHFGKRSISDMGIRAVHGIYLNIEFRRKTNFAPFRPIRVSSLNEDDDDEFVYFKVVDFLKKRWIFTPNWSILAIFGLVISVATFVSLHLPKKGNALIVITASVAGAWLLPKALQQSNQIFLTRRSETTTYWERNRDDLVSKIVIATLAAIVGAIVNHFFKK